MLLVDEKSNRASLLLWQSRQTTNIDRLIGTGGRGCGPIRGTHACSSYRRILLRHWFRGRTESQDPLCRQNRQLSDVDSVAQ